MAKRKRKKTILEHADDAGTAYMGIGHTGGGAVVWAYVDGELRTWDPIEGTHAQVMGKSRNNYWRGRYEGFTGSLSFVPPVGTKYQYLPTWLREKLEERFGGDFQPYGFNPR